MTETGRTLSANEIDHLRELALALVLPGLLREWVSGLETSGQMQIPRSQYERLSRPQQAEVDGVLNDLPFVRRSDAELLTISFSCHHTSPAARRAESATRDDYSRRTARIYRTLQLRQQAAVPPVVPSKE